MYTGFAPSLEQYWLLGYLKLSSPHQKLNRKKHEEAWMIALFLMSNCEISTIMFQLKMKHVSLSSVKFEIVSAKLSDNA